MGHGLANENLTKLQNDRRTNLFFLGRHRRCDGDLDEIVGVDFLIVIVQRFP